MLLKLSRLFLRRPDYREVKNEDDFEFVINRCTAEAKDGHFSNIYSSSIPAIQKGLRHQMACAVNDLPYPFEPGNPRQGTGARLLILHRGRERIGFLLLLEDMPGTWREKIEIHLISILPEHRNNSLGRHIVKDILKMTTANEIYARCYAKSKAMIHILKSTGFTMTKISEIGTETLTLHR